MDTPSDKSPPVEPAVPPEKVVVKQEWVELCEQQRLPVEVEISASVQRNDVTQNKG